MDEKTNPNSADINDQLEVIIKSQIMPLRQTIDNALAAAGLANEQHEILVSLKNACSRIQDAVMGAAGAKITRQSVKDLREMCVDLYLGSNALAAAKKTGPQQQTPEHRQPKNGRFHLDDINVRLETLLKNMPKELQIQSAVNISNLNLSNISRGRGRG